MNQTLPLDMIETWRWMPQFDAWRFTLAKDGVEFKYERLVEKFDTRYVPDLMQFYYDDAVYTFEQQAKAFKQYRRKQIAELADWHPGFDMDGVSVSETDKVAGSPKVGDKIARNPKNHGDKWLVAAAYFEDNFEAAA